MVSSGKLNDAAVKLEDLGTVVFRVPVIAAMEDGWDLTKNRLRVLLDRSLGQFFEILDRRVGVNAQEDIVGAAQDDNRIVLVARDEAVEAVQHLRGGVAMHAEVDGRVVPALGD